MANISVNIILPFIISSVIALLAYICTNNKGFIVFIILLMIVTTTVIIYGYNSSTQDKEEYEDFYLPFFNFPINYGMTRADILNILEERDEYNSVVVLNGNVAVKKEWFEVESYLHFQFDEDSTIKAIYWGSVIGEESAFSKEQIQELGSNVLHYFDDCYGKGKYFESKQFYYWENTQCYKVEFSYGDNYFIVAWGRPDIELINENQINIE